MIPRRKHNASSNSLGPPDDKHASNDHILSEGGARDSWRAALRRRLNRKTLHKRLPITQWLPQYNVEKAVGDLIAGVTVGLTVIPQSLAYSNIAGLPPQHGLYGSFLGCFIYIVLGGCRAVPAGPTAIASLLTWQVAQGVLEKAVLLTFLAGLVKLLMGALGLGFLINFVSGPVSSGFTSAVALMIATSQVKDLFAITVTGTTFLQQWISIFRNMHHASLWDPVLGFSCITVLLTLRRIGMVKLGGSAASARQRLVTRCLWLLGTCRNAIVVVVTGVLGYWFAGRVAGQEVPFRLMGPIPSGVPVPSLPPTWYVRADNTTADFVEMVSELGSGVLVIPLIVLLEDIAICKAFSDGRTIDATQEMIALGVAGIANSFVQAYPGGGSLARSVVANSSGVRTTFSGLYTGIMVILALQFFTAYFEFIPKAALAAVIISAILFMVEYDVVKPMWRAKSEFIPKAALAAVIISAILFMVEYDVVKPMWRAKSEFIPKAALAAVIISAILFMVEYDVVKPMWRAKSEFIPKAALAAVIISAILFMVEYDVVKPMWRAKSEFIPKAALAAVIISAILFMVEYDVVKPMWRAKSEFIPKAALAAVIVFAILFMVEYDVVKPMWRAKSEFIPKAALAAVIVSAILFMVEYDVVKPMWRAKSEFIPKAALAAVIISAILFMVEYDVVKPMWRAKSEFIPKAALAAVIVSAILFMVEYDVVKPMWRAKSEFIPKAALAAVIVSAILFMVEYDVVKPMWRAKKLDLVPGLGTFVLCLTLPLELGILTGVIVNIIFILYHAARPKFSVEMLKTEAGVEYVMITPDRCLMFPSVDYVRRLVTKVAAGNLPVVLECTHIYSADYTAAKSIEQLTADFHERRQPLYFYNVKPSVCSIFEAVAKPEHFVVFYEDEELDRLLAADDRVHAAKPPAAPRASPPPATPPATPPV